MEQIARSVGHGTKAIDHLFDVCQSDDGKMNYVSFMVGHEWQINLSIEEARMLAIRIIKATNQAEVRNKLKQAGPESGHAHGDDEAGKSWLDTLPARSL